MERFLFLLLIISNTVYCQNGSITNISVTQRPDGSGLVDVYFNLDGPGSNYYISLEVSFNAGSTYTPIDPGYISGDIGPISQGTNKHLIWNGLLSSPNTYSSQTKLKIIAGTIPTGAITDIDGNIYQTVTIGTQTWMKENLKTTRYRNGTNIEYPGSNSTLWEYNTTGAYAWYDNDIFWKDSYGALYNWYAVNNVNGLCPNGWHVPSDTEWTQLTSYISGGTATGGNQLKACRQVNSPLGGACNTSVHPRWDFYDTSIFGTDDYGFSALPAGYRYVNGPYNYLGYTGRWWSGTVYSSSIAWFRGMLYYSTSVFLDFNYKTYGFSVRCVRDL